MLRHRRLLLSAVAVVGLLLGGWWLHPAEGQPVVPPAGTVPKAPKLGKYQVTGVGNMLVLCDTETGQLWSKAGNNAWQALESPVYKAGTTGLVPPK